MNKIITILQIRWIPAFAMSTAGRQAGNAQQSLDNKLYDKNEGL
ncbi:MAG: hypothetical protein WC614_11635 [bacterium]